MIPIRYLLITVLLGLIALFQHAARADELIPLPHHSSVHDYSLIGFQGIPICSQDTGIYFQNAHTCCQDVYTGLCSSQKDLTE